MLTMGKTLFKRLAEVQIIHDYFLTLADGASFFEKNREEKQLLLEQRMTRGSLAAHAMFDILPDQVTQDRIREYKLVFARTPLGFVIAAEVEEETDAGETRYRPTFPIPPDVAFSFCLKSKLADFRSLTNVGLASPFPAIFYFTNKDKQEFVETTLPPHTSLPISLGAPPAQGSMTYEMGSLLDFGGIIREATRNTLGSNPSNWEDMPDRKFVSLADNILLPHSFAYKFRPDQAPVQVKIILEDLSNNEVKTINKSGSEPLDSVSLNFVKVDENDETSADIPSGPYNLKVSLNGTPEIVHPVLLNDRLYQRECFGIIDIRMDEENSPFSLLDTNGFLQAKIDAAAQHIPHPVFEIRLENRRTYWRYHKEMDFTVDEINATSGHLDATGPRLLITKKPKELTETLVPFQNGSTLLLPHPARPNIRVEQDRIYSEIYINQSNGLLKN